MSNPRQRTQRHTVIECPACGGSHWFALLVQKPSGPLLFAGPGRTKEVEIELTCPQTGEPFPETVAIKLDEAFVGLADPFADNPPLEPAPLSETVAGGDAEFAEWMRTSRERGLDYCRTMLTTSAAGIPVHFTVLQYLGPLDGGIAATIFTFVPAMAFLGASTCFALAQRPKLVNVPSHPGFPWAAEPDPDKAHVTFNALRTAALRRIHRFANWGTLMFLIATAVAITVYATSLMN